MAVLVGFAVRHVTKQASRPDLPPLLAPTHAIDPLALSRRDWIVELLPRLLGCLRLLPAVLLRRPACISLASLATTGLRRQEALALLATLAFPNAIAWVVHARPHDHLVDLAATLQVDASRLECHQALSS